MKKQWRGLYSYPSHGRRRLRFMWGEGHEIHGQCDVRGGCAAAAVVKSRAKVIQSWIDSGQSTEAIARLIRSLPKARPGRPRKYHQRKAAPPG